MSIIKLTDISKHFKILNRHEGLIGAFRDLFSQDYTIIKAVDKISLDLYEGEIVGFLGPNGAGKSTTIKMMTGILEPSSGQISVNGNIPFKNRVKNAMNIGVVFGQRTQLWWDLPVIESFKVLKEIYEIDDKLYKENIEMFSELVNIKSLYNKQVRTLSLGQRMLCDITAAFLHNPKIIFLDEPTIGLDISVKSKIRTIIKELNQKRKTTIILTTHDISDIEALCKRIIIIDKGKIIYDDVIQKIATMFGAYRTLSLSVENANDTVKKVFCEKIQSVFKKKDAVTSEITSDGWIKLTVNQDKIKLADILNFATKKYQIKDVKIEEIKIENVIKKIYDGHLL